MEKWISQIENSLLIAPSSEHPYFLFLKEQNPHLSFKLTTKEEVLASYYGKLKAGALFDYLASHEELPLFSAELYLKEAMKLTKDHPSEQVHSLWMIRKELEEKGLVNKNEYYSFFLHQHKIVLFGYDEDEELKQIFKEENISPSILKLPLLDKKMIITSYNTIEEEIADTFNKIIDLFESGVSLNKIFLYINQEVYYYPLLKMAKDFNLPIENPYQENYLSLKEAQDILKALDKGESIDDLVGEGPILTYLKGAYKQIDGSRFSSSKLKEIFEYLLKKEKLPISHYEEELSITSRHLFLDDEYVFVLGFEQGSFPLIHQDNDYLSDKLKAEVNQNTSKLLNRQERSDVQTLVFFNKNIVLSYKNEAVDGPHHPSLLIDSWNIETKKGETRYESYSLPYAQKTWGMYCDYERKYGVRLKKIAAYESIEKPEYLTYDNAFQQSARFDEEEKIVHAYTSLSSYAKCPYKYYLSYVLHIDPFEGTFYSKFGDFVHKVLEHNYDQNLDFDKVYEEAIPLQEWSVKDLLFIDHLKPYIKELFEFNLIHQKKMDHPDFELEDNIEVVIDKELQASNNDPIIPLAHPIYLKGKIDKIVLLGQESNFAALVDYKTGSETFDPRLLGFGQSTQLPTYGLLLKYTPRLKDKTIVGAYIQHVLPDRIVPSSGKKPEPVYKSFALRGITTDNIAHIAMLDPDYVKSIFIRNLSITKENKWGQHAKIFTYEEWLGYLSTTLAFIKEADAAIHRNLFPIAPKFIGSKIKPCDYCSFKDICFVKEEDKIKIDIETGDESDAELD